MASPCHISSKTQHERKEVISGSWWAGREEQVAQVADGVVLHIVHVAERSQRLGWQGLVLEVVEVDALEIESPGPRLVRIDGGPHNASYSDRGYVRMVRGGHPPRERCRTGPRCRTLGSQRRPTRNLHRPLQRVALAEVYRRHAGRLRLARRVMGNATEAEDVTQEIFLRLWNQPERFDPARGSLRSFLLAQAHSRAVDAVRSSCSPGRSEAQGCLRRRSRLLRPQHEVWDLAWPTRCRQPWARCPTRSGGPSSSPTTTGAPTARWPSFSASPRGRSRAASATACVACAPSWWTLVSRGWSVISHEEAERVAGAYALDAVDVDEVREVEEHLDSCPAVGPSSTGCARWRAPWATRSRRRPTVCGRPSSAGCPIAGENATEVPPMPRLGGRSRHPRAAVASPRRTRSRGAVAAVAAFAVAAAAVAIVLGIGLVQTNHKVSNLQQAAGHQVSATVAAALAAPGHRVVELDSTTHRQLAEFVVVPDGRGFLVSSRLPKLGADSTYHSGGSWAPGDLAGVPRRVAHGRPRSPWPGPSSPRSSASRPSPPGLRRAPTAIVATGTV